MPNNIIENTFGVLGPDYLTQQLVAPILPSMVANRTFDKDDLFIVNSTLYKATTAIAVGDAIAVGTNCSLASTISEELSAALRYNDPNVLLNSNAFIEPTLTKGSRYTGFLTGYCKVGTRVTVHIGVTGLTATASNIIFTLPEGFRPKGSVSTKAGGSNVNEIGTITITTNGAVNAVPYGVTTLFGTITFEAVQ